MVNVESIEKIGFSKAKLHIYDRVTEECFRLEKALETAQTDEEKIIYFQRIRALKWCQELLFKIELD